MPRYSSDFSEMTCASHNFFRNARRSSDFFRNDLCILKFFRKAQCGLGLFFFRKCPGACFFLLLFYLWTAEALVGNKHSSLHVAVLYRDRQSVCQPVPVLVVRSFSLTKREQTGEHGLLKVR